MTNSSKWLPGHSRRHPSPMSWNAEPVGIPSLARRLAAAAERSRPRSAAVRPASVARSASQTSSPATAAVLRYGSQRASVELLLARPGTPSAGSSTGSASGCRSICIRSWHEQERSGRNFEVLHPLRLYRRDHPTHSRQELPARALLRVVFRQDARRRAKQADEEVQTEGEAAEVIDASAHEPRRIPSKNWRELIKKVWEADPLWCLKCSREPKPK